MKQKQVSTKTAAAAEETKLALSAAKNVEEGQAAEWRKISTMKEENEKKNQLANAKPSISERNIYGVSKASKSATKAAPSSENRRASSESWRRNRGISVRLISSNAGHLGEAKKMAKRKHQRAALRSSEALLRNARKLAEKPVWPLGSR